MVAWLWRRTHFCDIEAGHHDNSSLKESPLVWPRMELNREPPENMIWPGPMSFGRVRGPQIQDDMMPIWSPGTEMPLLNRMMVAKSWREPSGAAQRPDGPREEPSNEWMIHARVTGLPNWNCWFGPSRNKKSNKQTNTPRGLGHIGDRV